MKLLKRKTIYFDYASSTPIDKEVSKCMSLCERDFYANATSIHTDGVQARNIIEESRSKIAKSISAHKDEVIFTSSSTESCVLAIIGTITNYELRIKNLKLEKEYQIPHIITSEIEHPAVLENCKLLESRKQAEVTYIKVNEKGIVNPKEVRDAIRPNTVLVSIMYANNEVGTIQPIQEIAKEIRHYRKNKSDPQGLASGSFEARLFPANFPLFHTDATQAMNYLFTENIEKLGVDLLSFNGSKIYGPKGVGVLYKKRGVEISPIYTGGGQEFGLRSGTENLPSIAGIALALEITNKIKIRENIQLTKLRDYLINELLSIKVSSFEIILNGDTKERLPNNINISILGISSELLVVELDARGIEVSSKSACKSGEDDESYVIKAIREAQNKKLEEEGSLRITLGRYTKKKDLDKLISSLVKILEKYSKWKK